MYAADTIEAVNKASLIFAEHDSVAQYCDPEKNFGVLLAKSLGARDLQVAWDIYLFFNEDATWTDRPPEPIEWVHQLEGSSWADPGRLYQGNALSDRFREIMESLNKG